MLSTTQELFFEAEPKTFVNINAITKVVDQTDYRAVSKTDPGQRDWIAVVTIQGYKEPVKLTGPAARRLFLKCRSQGWTPPELIEDAAAAEAEKAAVARAERAASVPHRPRGLAAAK